MDKNTLSAQYSHMQRRTNVLIVWGLLNIILSLSIGWFTSAILLTQKESIVAGIIALIVTSNLQFVYEVWSLNNTVSESFETVSNRIEVSSVFLKVQSHPKLNEAIHGICSSSLQGLMLGSHGMTNSNLYILFENEIYRHLRECDNNLSQLSNGIVRVEKEKSNVFWTRVVRRMEKSYQTTNLLTSVSNSFGQSTEQAIIEVQRTAVDRLGQDQFSRIFIYENEEILSEFLDTIISQEAIGISVKVISLDRYNELGQEQWSATIGCSDFAIIDDEFVYITVVDDTTRKSTYVELTNNRVRLSAAQTLYQLLMKYASDASSVLS